jgi:hypothetical protein
MCYKVTLHNKVAFQNHYKMLKENKKHEKVVNILRPNVYKVAGNLKEIMCYSYKVMLHYKIL